MSDEIDEIEEGEGKKRPYKLLIILLIVFQVLTMGGLAYYVYSDISDGSPAEDVDENDVDEESEEQLVEDKTDSESEPKAKVELSTEALYHQTPSILSNLNMPVQYSYVSLKVSIRTYDVRVVEILNKKEMKIRSLVQSQVRDMAEVELASNEGLNKLTSKIKKKIGIVLKENDVDPKFIDDIFLADVIME